MAALSAPAAAQQTGALESTARLGGGSITKGDLQLCHRPPRGKQGSTKSPRQFVAHHTTPHNQVEKVVPTVPDDYFIVQDEARRAEQLRKASRKAVRRKQRMGYPVPGRTSVDSKRSLWGRRSLGSKKPSRKQLRQAVKQRQRQQQAGLGRSQSAHHLKPIEARQHKRTRQAPPSEEEDTKALNRYSSVAKRATARLTFR